MADDKNTDEQSVKRAKALAGKVRLGSSQQYKKPLIEKMLADPEALRITADYAKAVEAYRQIADKYNNRDDSAFGSAYDPDGNLSDKEVELKVFSHATEDAKILADKIKAKEVPDDVIKELDRIKTLPINSDEPEIAVQALKKKLAKKDPEKGTELGKIIDRAVPRYRVKGDPIFEEYAAADMAIRKMYDSRKKLEDRAEAIMKEDGEKAKSAASQIMSQIFSEKYAQKDDITLAQELAAIELAQEPKAKDVEKEGMSALVKGVRLAGVKMSGLQAPEGVLLDVLTDYQAAEVVGKANKTKAAVKSK